MGDVRHPDDCHNHPYRCIARPLVHPLRGEFLSEIGGYFSTFKTVFVFTLIAITAVGVRLTIGQAIGGLIAAAMMLILGVYWTAIKEDYRHFVSGGEQAQIVVVSPVQAFEKIINLAGEVDAQDLTLAAERLAIDLPNSISSAPFWSMFRRSCRTRVAPCGGTRCPGRSCRASSFRTKL